MSRSYLLRRPKDDDDDYGTQTLVRAKPIEPKIARNLGISGCGKDFVRASEKSQQQFYGSQAILHDDGGTSSASVSGSACREMTHDERNKLNASIIKAELKGDMERVKKLKEKLEDGIVEAKTSDTAGPSNREGVNTEILMKMDKRSGQVVPIESRNQTKKSESGTKRKGTIESIFGAEMSLEEMVAEEKKTTAEDQLTIFDRAAKICSNTKTDDDSAFDDNMLSHPKKRRHEEKDTRQKEQRLIKEHKFIERTLDSCPKCIDSRLLEKHAIVATGIKTYLAVVNWDGLSAEHCYICPMSHYASSAVLDEDVWDEARLWMKGLVAMWRSDEEGEDQDCVFIENARFVKEQRHMVIECIPLPRDIGDMAPIYFKKAIMECEKEWSDNKKLIDLSKNPRANAGVRGVIPKGFPFFSVNFGLQPGYAHIIEDERNFPANFAQEIVGGMLDLPHRQWMNPKRQTFDEVKCKRDEFAKKWAKYDWTEIVKQQIKEGGANEEEQNTDN